MIQPYAQQPWPPVWNPAVYSNYNSGAAHWPAPVPAWPVQQTWQVNRPAVVTSPAPQTWQVNREMAPVTQPRPLQNQPTARSPQDKMPYFVGGGLLGAAGLAAYMATQVKKKKTDAPETKPALLKLEDFKLNPGVDLSTVAKRHAMTQKIVDAVFPRFYEMYQTDFKNCDAEANALFNTVLRRELCKDACLKVVLGNKKHATGQQDAEFKPAYLEQVVQGINLTGQDAQTPCYDLGKLTLHPTPSRQRSYDKEALYSLMLHETNHLVYFLANDPSEFIKHSHKTIRGVVDYRTAFVQFLHLNNHPNDLADLALLYGDVQPIHKVLWKQFGFLTPKNQSPYHSVLASTLGKEILQVSKEQLLQEYKYYIKNELEAFATYRLRFTQPGAVRGDKANPEDLHDGIRALWLRELCRFYEKQLKLPPSEHTNLPITVNGVAFKD